MHYNDGPSPRGDQISHVGRIDGRLGKTNNIGKDGSGPTGCSHIGGGNEVQSGLDDFVAGSNLGC